MTSVQNIQTPSAKGASVNKKYVSTEKSPVNNKQTSNSVNTKSIASTMAPMAKPLSSFNKKRSSTANNDGEGTGNESLNLIKRTKVEGEKRTLPSRRPPYHRQSASSRGLTRPEEHVFDIPGGAIMFGKTTNKKDVEGFSSAVTPSKKLTHVKIPAQVFENKTAKLSSEAKASSSTSSASILDAEEDDEEEIQSPPLISPARLTSLNETMRKIYNAKSDDTNSLVLCKDIVEIMKIKDYNFAVMSKRLAKLEKDAEANLSVAEDSKSDFLENAKDDTSHVKAELQNKLEESHEVTNERKVKFDELAVYYKRSITVHEDALKGASTAKKEVEQSRIDVTNSVAYKELLEKFNASQKRAAIAEEKVLRGDPADNRKISHLQRQLNELEEIYKNNVKAYEGLGSKYDQKCQAHNDKSEELKKEIHSRKQKIESEFQRGRNIMENHYLQENQHLRTELRNYQLENQHLKSEIGYYRVEHQHLKSELAQGRQWANSIVKSCPYPVGRAIEAGNARDRAFAKSEELVQARNEAVRSSLGKLQGIEQEKARIVEEHNEYLRGRALAAGSEDNSVPYIKSESAEKARHDGMYSATPPHRRQTARAQSPDQKWYQNDDANNLREYQPVNINSSQGIHRVFSSIKTPGDSRNILKCPHNRGSRGNNCDHCGEQIFFEGDKEFASKQASITPQKEDSFDDLPDYASDEPLSPPPEQPNRGARSYTEVGVQPYAAIPGSLVEDDTNPSSEEECSHLIRFAGACGVCGEAIKDASKVSRQAAPIANNKVVGTSTRRKQSLTKKSTCQHLRLDIYGVCEGCLKCQHLEVNDDNGNCKFCWKNINPPVAAPGVAASPDSSPSPPPSRQRRNRPEVDSESKSDSKAGSRPTKKVKTMIKNSLDSMFPTLPASHPAKANPFLTFAASLSSSSSKSSAASFFKAAHPGWKTPAVLSSPVSPIPAAPTAKELLSAAATPFSFIQPNYGPPFLAPPKK
ncbi:predicted protein [Sclerotinia sclerotiorum 1980 UF-70]|uniref:Uncharacterized protein n=2 Tax=Sclerotinia sclerotiorum (strain ATCC 18683 / 1980 / Ss-1) TaxID=665079 RepID=A7EGV4_SCLS1|nr:predicted protein [Sclerotinia sclerotiorum 1980 UF-70]APA06828.1 hypothetical protein sscle_02g015980 [Sclerotinia sclerotiorum 1980 UF-70]EDO02070.1 predicted protein [Sclerotinia sclerotiorum 1980 UF-70]